MLGCLGYLVESGQRERCFQRTRFISRWRALTENGKRGKRKLTDIGLCRVHRILEFFTGRLFFGHWMVEVANPRQSTSGTKVFHIPNVNKSRIALLYSFGFYPCFRKSSSRRRGNVPWLVRKCPFYISCSVYSEIV